MPHAADLCTNAPGDQSERIANPAAPDRQPDLRVHGHVHGRPDYRVGSTRILCNERGHIEEDSAKDFDPSFTIDVPSG